MTALCTAATDAAWAVKVVDVPAATVTAAGIVRAELLEIKLTAVPPAGARSDRMRVQVLDPPGARLDGVQAMELGATEDTNGVDPCKVRDAFREEPLRVTVTVAC